jgi:amino acid transporter
MRQVRPIKAQKLTLIPLVAATYFMVSGGPVGIEELIGDAGYRDGLVILLLIPLLWSLPTGLMVGELSAAIPAEGGFYVWVRRAMGPFWGFQESWLSLMSSIFDMAAYPAVFVLSLAQLWPAAVQHHNGVLISAGLMLLCLLWNLFGSKAVGSGSLLLGFLLLSPFALLVLISLLHHTSQAGVTGAAPRRDLLGAVIIAMWNYMGWDNASTVAGEVADPQKTYPRVMFITLAAIALSYILPIAAIWITGLPSRVWTAGSWTAIAARVGGRWLAFALIIASMISTLGIVNSLMMSYSRLPLAMAEDGYAPKCFARKLTNDVPWVSLLTCTLAWMAALGLSLDRLLMLDILLYGASLALEFAALVLLRLDEPALARPFAIPGGTAGAIAVGIGPTALLCAAAVRNRHEMLGSISALSLGLILMAAGFVVYWMLRPSKKSGSVPHSSSNDNSAGGSTSCGRAIHT